MRASGLRVLSLVYGLACTVYCTPASATDLSPEEIADKIRSHTVVRGEFEQLREVPGLPGGLRSQGEFTFWREHGIYWATLQPVHRQITYRSDQTLAWPEEDGTPQTLNSRQDRQLRGLLMSVFSFDLQQLEQDFSSHWSIDGDHWGVTLTPRSHSTRRFLESVTLGGSDTLSSLRIASRNGEVLSTQFRQLSSPDRLSASDCTALFAYSASECEQLLHDHRP